MKKQHVQLTPADREFLEDLIRKGQHTAKAYRRAMALLALDRGQTYTAVKKTVHVSATHSDQGRTTSDDSGVGLQ